jgi:hypothetical protein
MNRVYRLLDTNFPTGMKLCVADKTYRDALESVALAMTNLGISEDDIISVLVTAIDGYTNSL